MQPRIPNKIDHNFTELVRLYAEIWIPKFELREKPLVFGVNQVRGWAHKGTIVIPTWLLRHKESEAYIQEYIIHELSHVKDVEIRGYSNHGPEFWEIFCKVCPPEWWHFEERYKPREFKRAGMHLLDVFAKGKRPKDLTEDDV